ANQLNGRAIRGINADASALLVAYAWPGNVRDLRNAIERAVVIARGDVVTADDLPERVRSTGADVPAEPAARGQAPPGAPEDFRTQIDRFESELILTALREAGWNQTEAARRLRLPLRTFIYKMNSHGIRKRVDYGA